MKTLVAMFRLVERLSPLNLVSGINFQDLFLCRNYFGSLPVTIGLAMTNNLRCKKIILARNQIDSSIQFFSSKNINFDYAGHNVYERRVILRSLGRYNKVPKI